MIGYGIESVPQLSMQVLPLQVLGFLIFVRENHYPHPSVTEICIHDRIMDNRSQVVFCLVLRRPSSGLPLFYLDSSGPGTAACAVTVWTWRRGPSSAASNGWPPFRAGLRQARRTQSRARNVER